MPSYRIENTESAVILGTYEADSEEQALDLMAKDAGYASYADSLAAIESDGSDIRVTVAE